MQPVTAMEGLTDANFGGAGEMVMNVNGAFMGLPFHSHTSVLHEVVVGAKHFMFYIGNDTSSAFIIGLILGFGCMFGDSFGSFISER